MDNIDVPMHHRGSNSRPCNIGSISVKTYIYDSVKRIVWNIPELRITFCLNSCVAPTQNCQIYTA